MRALLGGIQLFPDNSVAIDALKTGSSYSRTMSGISTDQLVYNDW